MENIKLDLNHSNIKQEEIMIYASKVTKIHEELHEKSKDENEFLGWLDLPSDYDKKEVEKIKKCAKKIQKDSEVLVVIGIGGSYLGARAVIESLTNTFYNSLPKEQRKTPQILYAGNNLNPNYLNDLIELIGNRDLSINVISKSGTTTEPAVAFRIFRELLENKYGLDEARKRIYVTTVSEIVRLVIEASNTKAPIKKIVDKISGVFVPVVIIIAIITLIIYLLLGFSIGKAIITFVTILVVACPCSLGLATPLAMVIS